MPKEQDESSTSSVSRASSVPRVAAASTSKRTQPPHPLESPAKRQSKWSAEEDAMIIDLRQNGMKWEDISKRLPGRSAISCRLHYQNYLERRSEWDEERKNKLARLYERFKPEMWAKIAEEMTIPWRAAEAMHWQLGDHEMAQRAGVQPFALSSTTLEPHHRGRRGSATGSKSKKDGQPRQAVQSQQGQQSNSMQSSPQAPSSQGLPSPPAPTSATSETRPQAFTYSLPDGRVASSSQRSPTDNPRDNSKQRFE